MIVDEDVRLNFDVEDFLEHHGIKGQKWGIRNQRRMNNYIQVGKGQGSVSQKVRAGLNVGPIDFVKGHGFKGAAARKGARQKKAFQNIATGKATARNVLTRVAAVRYQDVFPTSKSKTNTKAAVGASIAGAILIAAGKQALRRA